MNLVFYSNFNKKENKSLDKEVVNLISNPKATFTYIPAETDGERKHYNDFVEYYSTLGFSNFDYFDLDKEYKQSKLTKLFESDVIFLSGGNTFRFLYLIKIHQFDYLLREYISIPGKTLIGVSAGAMIMTPSIMNTVVLHKMKGDFDQLNTGNLKAFTGLRLVDFEFVPHLSAKHISDMLKKYLAKSKNPIYGCPDGSGIIVKEKEITLLGKVRKLK